MQYAIIADIHSNLAAFSAVLEDIRSRRGADEIWCLGDTVGYGPEPHECLELLRKYPHVAVAGNHDLAAVGKIDTADFNPEAAAAAHWTARQLSPEDIEYLAGLPLVVMRNDFTLVHGSPRYPIWEYIFSIETARENFPHFQTRFCLVGHSHVPIIFREDRQGNYTWTSFLPDMKLKLDEDRLIINPGGVGQPRDDDPRASYAIYDSEARVITLYRVTYDIKATQAKMTEYKLPVRLINRLSYGV